MCVSLCGCVVSISSLCFFIWLCCEHLQCVSLFGCVVSISSACFFIWLCCEH